MARSLKKGPFVGGKLEKKVEETKGSKSSKVIKDVVEKLDDYPRLYRGLLFAVHNGKKFIPVFVTEEMVGHKTR